MDARKMRELYKSGKKNKQKLDEKRRKRHVKIMKRRAKKYYPTLLKQIKIVSNRCYREFYISSNSCIAHSVNKNIESRTFRTTLIENLEKHGFNCEVTENILTTGNILTLLTISW